MTIEVRNAPLEARIQKQLQVTDSSSVEGVSPPRAGHAGTTGPLTPGSTCMHGREKRNRVIGI
jgi:hypothetical protein